MALAQRVVYILFLLFFIASVTGAQEAAKPLTLAESVETALRQSPQARAARFAWEAAQTQADREKPVARPTLNATASGTLQGPRVTFPRPDETEAVVLPERVARLDLTLEQVVYRPGLGAARQRYAAQSYAAALDYRKALADLALSVRKAYLDVLRAESGVRTAQDGLAAAQRYQALVQRQIAAGFAKPVDAETVAAQVAEAQAGVTQAEGGLALARLAFNRALGRPLSTPVSLEPVAALPVVPEAPEAAIAAALRNRLELVSLEQNLVAARAGVSLARVQSQPAWSVRGQMTEQTPSAFVHEHYLAATLEVRWPILDGGKAQLDTREAQAQAQRLEALLEDTRQAIALDVTQAWQKMREAQARMALAQTQVRGAQATATVAEKAYEVGRGTVIEVQSAQREVRAARERELQALYDLHTAAAEFDHAQGAALPGLEAPGPRPARGARHGR
ncbi:MAG TPA: TolC family protein [Chthonomonadaceae bacterium]|nr:TolC family protein [Chthonomonadaceae bacterium]